MMVSPLMVVPAACNVTVLTPVVAYEPAPEIVTASIAVVLPTTLNVPVLTVEPVRPTVTVALDVLAPKVTTSLLPPPVMV